MSPSTYDFGFTRPLDDIALTGIVASVAHLAYHLGAIRQIARQLAGPRARKLRTD